MVRTRSVGFVVLLVAACGGPTEPRRGLVIETAATEFARDGAVVTIPFSITNGTAAGTYLVAACDGQPMVSSERLSQTTWLPHTGARCLAVYPMSPIPIVSGARLESVVALRVGDAGTYRLRLGLSTERKAADAPSERSNSFEVR